MLNNRHRPDPVTPHGIVERRVNDLRDYSPPPSTYRLLRQLPDGRMEFVGEFETPKIQWNFNQRGTAK